MKISLINYIECPDCHQSSFGVIAKVENKTEVREGTLLCDVCCSSYQIKKGIVHLFKRLGAGASDEIKALRKEASEIDFGFQDKRWLLNFPNNTRFGVDERAERITRLSSENVLLSWDEINNGEGLDVLELGAGNCWATARLAEKHRCIALDVFTDPPRGLEAADVFIDGRAVYFERVSADMRDLPFREAAFDMVYVSSALHHSENLEDTLKGIFRILKNHGKVYILNEPVQGILGKDRGNIKSEKDSGFNEHRYSLRRWKDAFYASGFNYQILLPANFLSVIKSRNRLVYMAGLILLKNKSQKFKKLLTLFLLTVFDGFFNAVLKK